MNKCGTIAKIVATLAIAFLGVILHSAVAIGQAGEESARRAGGEANLVLPDIGGTTFFGVPGTYLLYAGLLVCGAGLFFGMLIYRELQNMPVHASMLEVSELIYETCKTYLINQGKFMAVLWAFIACVIVLYFGWLSELSAGVVVIIVCFSIVGILGSYGVAWFGIRVNTFANSRTAFASLKGLPYPVYAIPIKAGYEYRHDVDQRRAVYHALHFAFRRSSLRWGMFHRIRDWRKPGCSRFKNRGRYLYEDCRYRLRLDEDRIQDQRGRCS